PFSGDVLRPITIKLGGYQYLASSVVDFHISDRSHGDILVAHTSLTGFNTFRRVERYDDFGPYRHPIAGEQATSHQHGEQRDQPYPGKALFFARPHFRYGTPPGPGLVFPC